MTISWVGTIGVSPVSTTNVRKADSSASTTATIASRRRSDQLRGSAAGESSISVAASAVVIGEFVRSWRNSGGAEAAD